MFHLKQLLKKHKAYRNTIQSLDESRCMGSIIQFAWEKPAKIFLSYRPVGAITQIQTQYNFPLTARLNVFFKLKYYVYPTYKSHVGTMLEPITRDSGNKADIQDRSQSHT